MRSLGVGWERRGCSSGRGTRGIPGGPLLRRERGEETRTVSFCQLGRGRGRTNLYNSNSSILTGHCEAKKELYTNTEIGKYISVGGVD